MRVREDYREDGMNDDWTLPVIDLAGLAVATRLETARSLAERIALFRFDLARAP